MIGRYRGGIVQYKARKASENDKKKISFRCPDNFTLQIHKTLLAMKPE